MTQEAFGADLRSARAGARTCNTRHHQGVGLGLTLARMSARAMDGDVSLEATGPEGSTFLWQVTGVTPPD